MLKKVLFSVIVIVLLAGVWYFFIKSHDYRISFEIKNPKGVAYENIVKWNNGQPKSKQEVFTILKEPYSTIHQEFKPTQDSIFAIDWQLSKKNDSITKINGYFTDKNSSLKQRAKILFGKTDFVKRSISFAKDIREYMSYDIETHRISKIDTTTILPKKYIYTTLSTTVANKANLMISENAKMMSYINQNELTLNGFPFLKVESWDKTTDSITFKFCYPIKEVHSSPNNLVTYKEDESYKAMQIIYNGNYRKSHVAWYAYEDYFDTIEIDKKVLPTEVFMNDPHQGGDELKWVTKVLIPLDKE